MEIVYQYTDFMKIINRIVQSNCEGLKNDLDRLGANYSYDEDPFFKTVVLEINEEDDLWLDIVPLVEKYHLQVTPRIEFSKAELDKAELLQLQTKGYFGYPQPEDGYLDITYDLTGYCHRCGMGSKQKAPFRLKAPHRQKRSHFFMLNWVFDVFFVRPEVKAVLENEGIRGVDYLHPVLHKTGETIDSLFQMKLLNTAKPGMVVDGMQTVTCREANEESHVVLFAGQSDLPDSYPFCHRVKYHYPRRSPLIFSSDCFNGALDIVKSYEYMGSGASANQVIIVSQKVRQLALEYSWRGISFEPVHLV